MKQSEQPPLPPAVTQDLQEFLNRAPDSVQETAVANQSRSSDPRES